MKLTKAEILEKFNGEAIVDLTQIRGLVKERNALLIACKMILESEHHIGSSAVAEVTIYSLNKARNAVQKAEEK